MDFLSDYLHSLTVCMFGSLNVQAICLPAYASFPVFRQSVWVRRHSDIFSDHLENLLFSLYCLSNSMFGSVFE